MSNDQASPNSTNSKKYDLEEKTLNFSKSVLDFCGKLPDNKITKPLISQLVRAATSVGANYSEADEANSKKDFVNKIAIAKKESKETKYWLKLLMHTNPDFQPKIQLLFREAQELNLILAAIIRNSSSKIKSL